jgi:hypothetical protein
LHASKNMKKKRGRKKKEPSAQPLPSTPVVARCIAASASSAQPSPIQQKMLDHAECRASSSSSVSSSMLSAADEGLVESLDVQDREEEYVADEGIHEENAESQQEGCAHADSQSFLCASSSQDNRHQPLPIHFQALQALIADENSTDSFSSAVHAHSSSGGSREDALQASLRRVKSYQALYRRKQKDLDKADRMLKDTEGQLESMREELFVAKGQVEGIRSDLLRLVGDIYGVASGSTTVHEFRRTNMVCTNYRSKAQRRANVENASSNIAGTSTGMQQDRQRVHDRDILIGDSAKKRRTSIADENYMDGMYAKPRGMMHQVTGANGKHITSKGKQQQQQRLHGRVDASRSSASPAAVCFR